jgi:RNA polymerase sigma factor (TIGR02999 family)
MNAATTTQLLIDWGNGNRAALDELTPRVYRELHELARKYLREGRPNQTLQPTALINELYLRLVDQPPQIQWEGRAHFFGIAARLMRIVLVDHARKRWALKRGGDKAAVTLEEADIRSTERGPNVLELDDALNGLARVDERKAKAIELR